MSQLNTSSFGYYEAREYHTIKGNLAYRRVCTHFAKKFFLVYNIHQFSSGYYKLLRISTDLS